MNEALIHDILQLLFAVMACACLVFLLRPAFRLARCLIGAIIAAWRDWGEVVDELLAGGDASTLEAATASPIPMVLACPTCHERHVDEGEWATRPHKTHLCSRCGALFRPANVPTVGVAALPEA